VTIDGSKKVAAKLGSDLAALMALVILGGIVLFLTSDPEHDLRAKLADVARQVGRPWPTGGAGPATGERVGALLSSR
jgi:hypothetical protein